MHLFKLADVNALNEFTEHQVESTRALCARDGRFGCDGIRALCSRGAIGGRAPWGSSVTSTQTEVVFETRTAKTVRGLESKTRAKLEREGWEFVSQTQGTVRSELTFRRPKPKPPWKVLVSRF